MKERFADLTQPAPPPDAVQVLGVDHVAYSVPDLEQAVRFFRDVLGATELYRRASGALSGAVLRGGGGDLFHFG